MSHSIAFSGTETGSGQWIALCSPGSWENDHWAGDGRAPLHSVCGAGYTNRGGGGDVSGRVFSLHGEEYYRRLERETSLGFFRDETPGVLATGGGIVSLRIPWSSSAPSVRPFSCPPGNTWSASCNGETSVRRASQCQAELRSLLRSREHLYRQARVHVSTSGKTIPDTVSEIVEGLNLGES